jgi:hypothetical protein
MRNKAWRRSPWPSLDAHISSALGLDSRSESQFSGRGRSRSVQSRSSTEGSIQLHARLNNINKSHCAGEIRYILCSISSECSFVIQLDCFVARSTHLILVSVKTTHRTCIRSERSLVALQTNSIHFRLFVVLRIVYFAR